MGNTVGADSELINRFLTSPHFTSLTSLLVWGLELLYALLLILAFAVLIMNITKLARARGEHNERGKAMGAIFASCICIAILGGIGTVVLLVFSFF